MIARIVIPLVIVIVLSDLYIDAHYFRRHYHLAWWARALWWLPCAVILIFTCALASMDNFAPQDQRLMLAYLLLLGLLTGPKAIFALCSSVGWVVRKTVIRTHRNYGHYLGLLLSAITVGAYVYGLTAGFAQIRVRNVDLTFADLPKSFDGYRIAHISDLHVGSFSGFRHKTLEAEVDSLINQHADLILFTGDMQNMHPDEVEREFATLRRIPKMTMIMGNHDYGQYGSANAQDASALRIRLERQMRSLGTLLKNQNCVIEAPKTHERLYIAGEENYKKPTFSDPEKTMRGIPAGAFVIYLQHNPKAWHDYILQKAHPQLTLSGHTHGGQMSLFGFRPTMLSGTEDYGLYEDHGRYLYVTAGLGGLVPFRLNLPNEITVITLHRK